MGTSRFSVGTFADYRSTNLLNADGGMKSISENFNYTRVKEQYIPENISVRESRDSDSNPNSRAIIFGIDFTASMGYLASDMINTQIPEVITGLIDSRIIPDPHLLVTAIRDYKASNDSPLQVSQFEADHTVIEQMQDFYGCSKGGGGNTEESYALAWAMAAYKTSIDCFEKRGQKGYLFTIGDDGPQTGTVPDYIMEQFGNETKTVEQIQKDAAEKYELFHIHLDGRSYYNTGVKERWAKVLGNRAMFLDDHTKVPELINAIIEINEFGKHPSNMQLSEPVRKALS